MQFITCSTATASPTVTATNCGWMLGQTSRLAFSDLPYGSTMGTLANLKLAATMTTLIAASDNTKVILPQNRLYDPQFGGTEGVYVGSNDNNTPKGKTILVGETVPVFTANYVGLTSTQYKQFCKIFGNGNTSVDIDTIGVSFFLGDTQLMVDNPGNATDVYKPIPVHSLFIGAPVSAGLHNLTMFSIRFELKKNWFETAALIDLSYNHEVL